MGQVVFMVCRRPSPFQSPPLKIQPRKADDDGTMSTTMKRARTNQSKLFSKRGCCAGFTAEGRPVNGTYSAKTQTWKVWTSDQAGLPIEVRTFPAAADADAYAQGLIDAEATARLKWWE